MTDSVSFSVNGKEVCLEHASLEPQYRTRTLHTSNIPLQRRHIYFTRACEQDSSAAQGPSKAPTTCWPRLSRLSCGRTKTSVKQNIKSIISSILFDATSSYLALAVVASSLPCHRCMAWRQPGQYAATAARSAYFFHRHCRPC